jgi:hypothetical protein
MIDWKTVQTRNDMPFDRQFLALWKGTPCIAQYDKAENYFWISFFPAEMAGLMKVAHEREKKFTHWAEITYPEDY